jgi:cytochrome P450
MAENTPADGSLLAALRDEGPLDDTLIGNLIHMVEFARFDLGGLWHWIVLEASKQRDFLEVIIEASESERRSLVASFVSEVLRTQQSEYVYRHVNQTIQYRGFVLPKGSRVRVCVWESHRDPKQFPEPNRFDPRRFYGTQASKPAYFPFGLDHHRCLGANWTIDLSAILLESLAAGFVLEGHNYGEPHKGRFHFEPGLDSSLTLLRKTPAPSAN